MEFDEYQNKFPNIVMNRSNGVLEMRFHTNDGPFQYRYQGGADPSAAPRPSTVFGSAFSAVASDRENKVIIVTGTGDLWNGPEDSPDNHSFPGGDAMVWDSRRRDGGQFAIRTLLDIEAFVISCINGPIWHHAEVPLLADIVLASDTAIIRDRHFLNRLVPGDGAGLYFLSLLGFNRGRYHLLLGKEITAQQGLDWGLVAEVMSQDQLLGRAHELADELVKQNPLVARYTRLIFSHAMKQELEHSLAFGEALEALGAMDEVQRREARQH